MLPMALDALPNALDFNDVVAEASWIIVLRHRRQDSPPLHLGRCRKSYGPMWCV
jgi:hypothetical protein